MQQYSLYCNVFFSLDVIILIKVKVYEVVIVYDF